MKTIYVGMALSGAPESFREEFQKELKDSLRTIMDVSVLDFSWTSHGPEANTDTSVYELDKTHTESADLCVFILDHASLGLGMEIMIRHHTGKPALFFVYKNPPMRTSRMVLGFVEVNQYSLVIYESVADIFHTVQQYFADNAKLRINE